jgi:sugar phosphate permease
MFAEAKLPDKALLPASSLAKTAAYSWFVLFVLTIVYVLNFIDRQLVAVTAELIKKDLALSDGQLGLLTGSIFVFFYATLAVPISFIADRSNRVRIVCAACFTWSICTALFGLGHKFVHLAISRLGVGVGEAGGVPPSVSLIGDYFPPRLRGTALGIFMLGVPLGMSAGIAAGALIAARYNWHAAFYLLGGVGIVISAALAATVREPQRGRFDVVAARLTPASIGTTVRLMAGIKSLRYAVAGAGTAGLVQYVLQAWTPSYLMRVQHASLTDLASFYSPVVGITVGAGTLLSGFMLDRFLRLSERAYALIPAALMFAALPFFVLALVSSHWRTT